MRVAISRLFKQMGLLIHTSFQTPEGFPIASVYCRIIEIIFRPHSGGQHAICIRMEFYASRDARINGRTPVQVPGLGDGQTYVGNLGDMVYLYGLLKTNLEEAGFVVENIDPDYVAPPPAPAEEPPAEAPAPAEEPPAETPTS